MFFVIFLSILAAAAAGLLIRFLAQWRWRQDKLTWFEYAVGLLVITLIVAPLTTKIGWYFAKQDVVTFNEYWNGWEVAAFSARTTCTRDGSCRYYYDCDPYVHVHEDRSCDSDGKNCTTTYDNHIHYHQCPYVTVETDYTVRTTLGDFTISAHRFPENPQQYRWRRGVAIPDYVIARAGTGFPPFWVGATARLDAGNPGPVTKRMPYPNYILASERTILKEYSGRVQDYLVAGMLPPVAHQVFDFYCANKVQFFGYSPPDPKSWQKAVAYLNAAFGNELQGDLHLVIVQHEAISRNPDGYLLALKAYWQNQLIFKKDAISKNTFIVVVGTDDGKTVSFARATTGMPLGNEGTTVAIRSQLRGVALTPEALVGMVSGKVTLAKGGVKVTSRYGNGALERILWGLEDPATKFKRVSMLAKDKDDVGSGFLYLSNEIDLRTGQKVGIIVIIFLLSLGVWAVLAASADLTWRRVGQAWRSRMSRRVR